MAISTQKLSLSEALGAARETRALEIGTNIVSKTPEVFRKHFPNATAVIVADANTYKLIGAHLAEQFQQAGLKIISPFIYNDPALYAEFSYVTELENFLKQNDAIPVAIGSGTINDLAKLASYRVGRGYMTVATAASMDGYTAFGASITFQGSKQTFNCPAPVAVVADLEIIRKAPSEMTASGYADLIAKVTAGADWILADTLDVEQIDQMAWNIVQGDLRNALSNPDKIHAGEPAAIAGLTEGLMLGGFAMQWSKTSRPASGAEHQFSHLWDMQHHTHNGQVPSHGFKVGIATLAITALYENLLLQPVEKLDVARCCENWPDKKTIEANVRKLFATEDFTEKAIEETSAKYITREELKIQLEQLKTLWPELNKDLKKQLIPFSEMKQMLAAVGAPVEPEQIGISRSRLKNSFAQAYHIRRRFTVLDLLIRTGLLDSCVEGVFASNGQFPLSGQK